MFSSELSFCGPCAAGLVGPAALRASRTLLHLDASHGPQSVVAQGAETLTGELAKLCPDFSVEHLRLWEDATRARMEYDLSHVQAKMARLSGSQESDHIQKFARIEEFAVQLASARGLVVSAPMWNYGPPHALKQYFDCVLHPGLTFREGPSGPAGIWGSGRPLVIITSAGGSSAKDHLTPWLVDVGAMLGFDKPIIINAANVSKDDRQQVVNAMTRDARAAAVQAAKLLPHVEVGGADVCAADDAVAAESAAADAVDEMGERDHIALAEWLVEQGGLSVDALESLCCCTVNGKLWLTTTEQDWRLDEDLGLEEEDVARILEVRQQFFERYKIDPARIAPPSDD